MNTSITYVKPKNTYASFEWSIVLEDYNDDYNDDYNYDDYDKNQNRIIIIIFHSWPIDTPRAGLLSPSYIRVCTTVKQNFQDINWDYFIEKHVLSWCEVTVVVGIIREI